MAKIIVLAPSAGGKSTLMRYMRDNTDFNIREMDEEVMKANNNQWPSDNDYKDKGLVPKVMNDILGEDDIIYFASFVPEDQLVEARKKGFKIILLDVSLQELQRRNKERMEAEGYDDSTSWLQLQLDTFKRLLEQGLIDEALDGHKQTEEIAKKLLTVVDNRNHSILQKLSTDFPKLDIKTLKKIGEGWDNEAVLVNGELVFRPPKERARHLDNERIEHVEVEIEVLSKLRNKLPVTVPEIVLISPDKSYYGYRYSKGAPVSNTFLADESEFVKKWVESVVAISEVLSLDQAKKIGIQPFPFNTHRLQKAEEVLDSGLLAPQLQVFVGTAVKHYLEMWRQAPHMVVHGDLGPGNWIYDKTTSIYTIIDWSDVCIAPQEFQMYRLIQELPHQLGPVLEMYKEMTGQEINKQLLSYCGTLSIVSIIGELLQKDPASKKNQIKLDELDAWYNLFL